MKTQDLLQQEIDDLIEEFSYIETPIDKMQFIIEFGNEANIDENLIEDETSKIHGCVSKAYLNLDSENDEILISFYADAVIIKGFLAIIADLLNNTSINELTKSLEKIKFFTQEVGLVSFLSPNRSNALFNIFKKIENFNN